LRAYSIGEVVCIHAVINGRLGFTFAQIVADRGAYDGKQYLLKMDRDVGPSGLTTEQVLRAGVWPEAGYSYAWAGRAQLYYANPEVLIKETT
jgi:hypothetical protein